jgi:hypothetical protein
MAVGALSALGEGHTHTHTYTPAQITCTDFVNLGDSKRFFYYF